MINHLPTKPPKEQHLSPKWATDVIGTHDLRWFDEPAPGTINHRPMIGDRSIIPPFFDHAHYLFPLLFAYDFIQQLGWAEHTSDWDWCVGLQTRDGVWHGDFSCTNHDDDLPEDGDVIYEDAFDLNGLTAMKMPFSLTESPFDYGDMEITLPESEFTVALRDIAIVYIDQR